MRSDIGMCPATLLANFGEPSADDIRGALEASREAGATGVSVWTPYLQILGGAEPGRGHRQGGGTADESR